MNFMEPEDIFKALKKAKKLTVTTDYNKFCDDLPYASKNLLRRLSDALTVNKVNSTTFTVTAR